MAPRLGSSRVSRTAVALLVLAIAGLCLRATVQEDVTRTLILGLANREQQLRTLEGMVTVETAYDAEMLAALTKADAANGAPKDLTYKERALHQVAFWLDFGEDRWRVEVAEVVSSGLNEWGFPVNYGRGEPPARTPVLVEVREGAEVTHWDVVRGSASIDQFNPQIRGGGGHMRPALERYLRLGYASAPTKGYALGGQEVVDGIQCYKLVYRERSQTNHVVSTLWVAPDKGFCPVRYSALSVFPDDPKRGSRSVITCSPIEVAEGIWLPAETTIASYGYVPERDRATYTVFVARFSDLKANEPIPECRFAVHLPLGTGVRDEAGHRRTVGQVDKVLPKARVAPRPREADPAYLRPLQGNEVGGAP